MARGNNKGQVSIKTAQEPNPSALTSEQAMAKFGWTTTYEQQARFYDLQRDILNVAKGEGTSTKFFRDPELRLAAAEKYAPFLKKLTEIWGHSELYSWMSRVLTGIEPFEGWKAHIEKGAELVEKYKAKWPEMVREKWELETRETEKWNENHRFRSNFKRRTPPTLEKIQKKYPLPETP